MDNNTTNQSGMDGKTIAIISYLTLIGFIIAIVMNGNTKSKLASFHIRQSLFLMLLGIVFFVVNMVLAFIPFLGWLISVVLMLGLFAFWIMGLISAANGEEKPLPVIGEMAQKTFAGIQ